MIKLNTNLFDTEGTWETYKHEIILDDTKIGTAYTMTDTEDDDMTYLEDFGIDEDYRNKGFGTEVLKALANKYGTIYMAPTDEDNQRLYERLGQEMTGDVPEVDQGFGVYEITR